MDTRKSFSAGAGAKDAECVRCHAIPCHAMTGLGLKLDSMDAMPCLSFPCLPIRLGSVRFLRVVLEPPHDVLLVLPTTLAPIAMLCYRIDEDPCWC